MKRILLTMILFIGLYPVIQHGRITILVSTNAFCQFNDNETEDPACNQDDPINYNAALCSEHQCDPTSQYYEPSKCGSCGIATTTSVAIVPYAGADTHYTTSLDSIRATTTDCVWGDTDVKKLTINFGACNNGTSWSLVLKTIEGDYFEEYTLVPGCTEVTGTAGNTTALNYCAQMNELNDLGHCPGIWYMLSAVHAHENVHAAHMSTSIDAVKSSIVSVFASFTVPVTGQSEADALIALEALPSFRDAEDAAFQLFSNEYKHETDDDHKGPTDIAEHNVVDQMVSAICTYAKAHTWTTSNPCTCPVCN